MTFSYTVVCEFDDAAVADQWLGWMRSEHLCDVCAAGAIDAEVIRCDSTASEGRVRCEARYHFESRSAFEKYEREQAPQLRAEGLKKFPLERGLHYARSTGVVAARFGP